MKISRNWLSDYVVSDKTDAELVDAFTQLGLECTSQKINSIDSNNQWIGYRSESNGYQGLAYIIKNSSIQILSTPYQILNDYY